MDLDHRTLRYIVTVAEEGNISRAAQKLHLSQPSLSHCILKQERTLGTTLFDRTRQPLRLTYAGERYVMAAREILSVRDHLEKEMEDIVKQRKGRVVVGATRTHSAYFLPRVIPRFKALYPDVEVALAEEIISSLESLLITDRAEIALLVTPAQNEQIFCEHLYNENLLLCLPEGHPLAESFGKSGVDLARLREEPFILYQKGMRVRKISDALFAHAGIQPRVELESQSAETIFNLVSVGMGCAILPASIVQYLSRVSRMPSFTVGRPPLSFSFAFAWKRNSYLSWAAQEFMRITRETLHEGIYAELI
ncbi:MAG: LysR family transcriptional regulator [Synergistaceae bacterium]|jgi:DNA-binding transcriptional LysR family regulator|nr:LysR family transcriptional regulator [Synergistaceae bacterium]